MKPDKPILTSLLQNDWYKFTMWYFIYRHFRDVRATFGFVNRTTKVSLSQLLDIGEVREQFEHARTVSFTKDELDWLFEFFPADFSNFIKNFRLPEYVLEQNKDQLRIEFPGLWINSTQWEIPCLMIINTLANRARTSSLTNTERTEMYDEGHRRLMVKTSVIKNYKYADQFSFIDFGTRRCDSPEWHDHVVAVYKETIPKEIAGTSNCYLARKYGLKAKGTRAHEPEMIMAALAGDDDEKLRQVPYKFCRLWSPSTYGYDFQVHLPDTYGSHGFFKFSPPDLAEWPAVRQDSGDPFIIGMKTIRWWERHDQDLKTKTLTPSDGLNIKLMLQLHAHFINLVRVIPGLGTNGTNDLPGIEPLSIVVKPIEANGYPTVKLSDNIAKAMGPPEEVERCKRVFHYDESFNKACVY